MNPTEGRPLDEIPQDFLTIRGGKIESEDGRLARSVNSRINTDALDAK